MVSREFRALSLPATNRQCQFARYSLFFGVPIFHFYKKSKLFAIEARVGTGLNPRLRHLPRNSLKFTGKPINPSKSMFFCVPSRIFQNSQTIRSPSPIIISVSFCWSFCWRCDLRKRLAVLRRGDTQRRISQFTLPPLRAVSFPLQIYLEPVPRGRICGRQSGGKMEGISVMNLKPCSPPPWLVFLRNAPWQDTPLLWFSIFEVGWAALRPLIAWPAPVLLAAAAPGPTGCAPRPSRSRSTPGAQSLCSASVCREKRS